MLRPMTLTLVLAISAVSLQQAKAQSYRSYSYYSGAAAGGPVTVVNPPAYAYGTAPAATHVYVRPANCGVYRYWDGAQCVDARDNPPALDRERPIR